MSENSYLFNLPIVVDLLFFKFTFFLTRNILARVSKIFIVKTILKSLNLPSSVEVESFWKLYHEHSSELLNSSVLLESFLFVVIKNKASTDTNVSLIVYKKLRNVNTLSLVIFTEFTISTNSYLHFVQTSVQQIQCRRWLNASRFCRCI